MKLSGYVVTFTPRLLYLQERLSGTHRVGGWVGPRDGLEVLEKRKLSYLHQD
jgi:hypothetical protein